jgi:hypothetical protein
LRRTLFAGLGARPGGIAGVGAIDLGSIHLECCWSGHIWFLVAGITRWWGGGWGGGVEVVDWAGEMGAARFVIAYPEPDGFSRLYWFLREIRDFLQPNFRIASSRAGPVGSLR